MTAASASDHCIEYAIIVVALLDNLCTLLKFGALIELDLYSWRIIGSFSLRGLPHGTFDYAGFCVIE